MSRDPLANQFAYNSPYVFSENRVIDCFELEGLEVIHIYQMVDRGRAKTVFVAMEVEESRDRSVYAYHTIYGFVI